MTLYGVEYLARISRRDHYSAKMVFNSTGALFFPVSQEHSHAKADGISYKDNYEGNALAAMIAPRRIEIRYHDSFTDAQVAEIIRDLLREPERAFMKEWIVTYQGRKLSLATEP